MAAVLKLAALLLFAAEPAFAMALDGGGVAWATELANPFLDEAAAFAIPAIGIGTLAIGVSLLGGVSMERISSWLVAGAILAGGAAFASEILGAEFMP